MQLPKAHIKQGNNTSSKTTHVNFNNIKRKEKKRKKELSFPLQLAKKFTSITQVSGKKKSAGL